MGIDPIPPNKAQQLSFGVKDEWPILGRLSPITIVVHDRPLLAGCCCSHYGNLRLMNGGFVSAQQILAISGVSEVEIR